VPPGKSILRINLDETSVCLFQGAGKGTVFINKRVAGGVPTQKVARFKRRCCLTHVAVICDNTELQPLMPQFILGNFATFLQRDLAMLRSRCPPNIVLVRQQSAWNNERMCAIIVRRIALALRAHIGTLQPVLFLDAVRLHITRLVLAACNAVGLWVVVVPARMTWLLQPLDTHSFLAYKAHLKAKYQSKRAELGISDLSIEHFLDCVYDAIKHVLQGRRWAVAFDQDGFGSAQQGLSTFARRELAIAGPLAIPADRPNLEQLGHCFPRRAQVPADLLYRPFAVVALPKPIPRPMLPRQPGLARPLPRLGRTRAQHRGALEIGEATAAPGEAVAVSGSKCALGVARATRLPRAKGMAVATGL
jgi:hypothetical protein